MSITQKAISALLVLTILLSQTLFVQAQSTTDAATQTFLPVVMQNSDINLLAESDATVVPAEVNAPPGAFDKTYPGNSAAGLPVYVTLTWNHSPGALYYMFCLDKTPDQYCEGSADANFIRVDDTKITRTLDPNSTYSWQVRAFSNATEWTPGNGFGQWWTFYTGPYPAAFDKTSPAKGATGVPVNVMLSWTPSSGFDYYAYCIDDTMDNYCYGQDNNFTRVNGTGVSPTGLQPNKTYSWQVRAYHNDGLWTPGNGSGEWWHFTTGSSAPGAFGKSSPTNGAHNLSAQPTLSWQAASGASYYGYCIDLTLDKSCDRGVDNFIRVDGRSVTVPSLMIGKTYEWQVRAYAANGEWTPADGIGNWWLLVTNAGGPPAFAKIAPGNGATNVATNVTLSWQPSSGATEYSYCIDTTLDNWCDQGVDNFVRVGNRTSAVVAVEPGKTYEWQARAYVANGAWTPANGAGQWWRFSTTPYGASPFGKLSPTNGATNVPTSVRLGWQPSANAVKYGYCIDNTLNNICDAGVDNFTFVNDTSVVLNLQTNQTYQWQARAYAVDGSWIPANGSGQFWSFSTVGSVVSGYTPGEFGVNEAGAANYKIPFVMPPGSAGMNPQIALTFDSRGSNTIVGWGWSLTGLSLISRCPTTLAQQGFIDGVDFDGNDQFCMDGQLLVAVSGAYGADQTIYRTENESFTKVVSVGRTGNGPAGFKAWTKAGLIIEYGFTSDSRLEASGRPDVLYWGVNRISDTKGNYMLFTYDKFTTTGELLPRAIAYTGNASANVAPYARVEFTYETRPDGRVQFIAGTAVRLAKRLQYLRTYVDNALVRDFRFGYEVSPTTGRSRLVNLTECSGDGQCLPSTQFNWSSKSTDELNFNGAGSGAWVGHTGGSKNNVMGDFNGDGRTDLAGYTGSNGQWHVCYSTGAGFTCSYQTAHAGGVTRNATGDFNGDGRTDLAGYTGSNGQWHVCLSTGSGFQCSYWQGHAGDPTQNNNVTTDFNGDGRSDLAGFAGSGVWHVCLSTGSNFTCTKWNAHNGGQNKNVTADFNGDGMADLAGYTGSNGIWHVCRFTGGGFECSYWTGHGGGVNNNVTADFNGDGLADMAGYMGNLQWHVCLSTGTGFECSVWSAHGGGASNNVVGDFNGDGLTDMAGYTGSNNLWHVCLSTGAGFACGNRLWTGHGGGSGNNASGDYNGDGKTDLAGYNESTRQWHVTLANDLFPDQLIQIVNGQGARIEVIYAPLTNSAVYLKANDASYPLREFQAPMYVVSSYGVVNGNGGLRRTNYTYYALRMHLQGRGFLSFASITAVDAETGIKTVTQYRQDHPYKSLPWKVEQLQPNGKLIQSVENTWAALNFSAAVQAAAMTEEAARSLYPTIAEETVAAETPVISGWSGDEPQHITETLALSATTMPTVTSEPAIGEALAQRLYLPLVVAGGDVALEETPVNPEPGLNANDYDFTNFIDFGELPPSDPLAAPIADLSLPDDALFDFAMSAVEISSASLEAITAPNAQGVTYFPYISQSIVKKFELDGVQVLATTTTTQYDSYGNPTQFVESSSDGYGKTTVNTYTNDTTRWLLGRLTLAKVTAQAPGQPAQMRTSAFAYDAVSGLLVREEVEPGTAMSLVKSYEYDALGNIVRSTTSGPDITTRSQSTQFDTRGRFTIAATNALGHKQTQQYDGRLGLPITFTDANGLVTTRKYDGFGRLLEETRPDGTKTTITYQLCNLSICTGVAVYFVRTEVSGTAPSVVYYDRIDRERKRQITGFNGQPIYVDTIYNARGEVQRVSDPYFAGATPIWTDYTYDLLGRTLSEIRPNGARTATTYAGLTVRMTNALNQTSNRTVNSQGWLLRSVDAANNAITYTYDSFGNLLTLVDPASNTTTMTYDLRGRKMTMRDPDSGQTSYRYNALGGLVWQKDAKGQEVTISYDLLGRMIQRIEPEGVSQWVYDTNAKGIGLLAAMSGVNGYKETYSYDTVSRLVKTTYTMDGQSFGMQTSYDVFGRVEKLTYPGGFKIRNKYTAEGYFKEVRNDATDALYWRADTRNARGQLEKAAFGNGLYTKQQFDANRGLLSAIQTGPTTNATQVQNLAYTFDALGNLTSRADKNQSLTEAFTYDPLNRLTRAQVNTRTADTVQYNALGNITFKSDVGSYTYGQNGTGPHAVTAITGGVSAAFAYDANGNRINSNGGSVAYTSFNLPTTITQGSNKVTYAYAPDHDRYKRAIQANGVTTTTLMVGTLYEKETAGSLTTQNYYIPAGGQMVAIAVMRSTGVNSTLYLHRDHLGSIDTITDAAGNVVERQSYDAWGKRRTSDWRNINAAITSMVRRGYTGHEQLTEVGLIHMNGRVYDPAVGRFLSPDPFVQAPDFSQSLNRYSYVLNNPLSLTDPSGFNWFSDAWKGVKDFFENNWKPIVTGILTFATAGWASGVIGLSFPASTMLGGFVGGVTQARLYGGDWIKAIRSGLIDGIMGYFNPINVKGTLTTLTGGLKQLTTNFAGSIWSATKYAAGAAMNSLVTNAIVTPIAKTLGLSLKELNLMLTGMSWAGDILTGYPDGRISSDWIDPEMRQLNLNGILGVSNRTAHIGRFSYFFDAVDVSLSYQGLLTASSWKYANRFGYYSTVRGHSEGSLDAINLARRGLVQSAKAYALPFGNIAPTNASVMIGDGDLVNGLLGGLFFNPDAQIMQNIPFSNHSRSCYGIAVGSCTSIFKGW